MVEIDASQLSNEEWFVIHALFGLRPGAEPKDALNFRKITLNLSLAEQRMRKDIGIERLQQRGFITRATNAEGVPLADPLTGEPIFKASGKIVSRMRSVDLEKT